MLLFIKYQTKPLQNQVCVSVMLPRQSAMRAANLFLELHFFFKPCQTILNWGTVFDVNVPAKYGTTILWNNKN